VVPTRIAIAAMEAELDRAASAGGLAPTPHD
jgi:hypothetical protein